MGVGVVWCGVVVVKLKCCGGFAEIDMGGYLVAAASEKYTQE